MIEQELIGPHAQENLFVKKAAEVSAMVFLFKVSTDALLKLKS